MGIFLKYPEGKAKESYHRFKWNVKEKSQSWLQSVWCDHLEGGRGLHWAEEYYRRVFWGWGREERGNSVFISIIWDGDVKGEVEYITVFWRSVEMKGQQQSLWRRCETKEWQEWAVKWIGNRPLFSRIHTHSSRQTWSPSSEALSSSPPSSSHTSSLSKHL